MVAFVWWCFSRLNQSLTVLFCRESNQVLAVSTRDSAPTMPWRRCICLSAWLERSQHLLLQAVRLMQQSFLLAHSFPTRLLASTPEAFALVLLPHFGQS